MSYSQKVYFYLKSSSTALFSHYAWLCESSALCYKYCDQIYILASLPRTPTLVVKGGNATLFSAAGAHPLKASPSSTALLMLPTRHRKISDAVAISQVFDFQAGALRSLLFNHHHTGSRRNEDNARRNPLLSGCYGYMPYLPWLQRRRSWCEYMSRFVSTGSRLVASFFFFFVKH